MIYSITLIKKLQIQKGLMNLTDQYLFTIYLIELKYQTFLGNLNRFRTETLE